MSKRSSVMRIMLGALAGALLLYAVAGSGQGGLKNWVVDLFGYGGLHSDDAEHGRDLFHTGIDISGIKGGLTYAGYDSRRDAQATMSYFGFGCLGSCDGYAAGFKWAARHDVKAASECIALRWDSLEGCAAYALREPGAP